MKTLQGDFRVQGVCGVVTWFSRHSDTVTVPGLLSRCSEVVSSAVVQCSSVQRCHVVQGSAVIITRPGSLQTPSSCGQDARGATPAPFLSPFMGQVKTPIQTLEFNIGK